MRQWAVRPCQWVGDVLKFLIYSLEPLLDLLQLMFLGFCTPTGLLQLQGPFPPSIGESTAMRHSDCGTMITNEGGRHICAASRTDFLLCAVFFFAGIKSVLETCPPAQGEDPPFRQNDTYYALYSDGGMTGHSNHLIKPTHNLMEQVWRSRQEDEGGGAAVCAVEHRAHRRYHVTLWAWPPLCPFPHTELIRCLTLA